jgi:curved DNA-binding protein
MAVAFEDYYQVLGVQRDASPDEIKRAYRKLARELHPDRNKAADAAAKFSKIGEAYEVLSDPDKRQKYDALGANWKAGQEFRPPPGSGFENMHFEFRGPGSGPGGASGGGGGFSPGGFSEFFEALFGGATTARRGGPRGNSSGLDDLFADAGAGFHGHPGQPTAAPEQEAQITVSLHEAFHGCTRRLQLQSPDGRKALEVKIPAGAADGSRIRLRGQGVVLKINIAPDPRFELSGRDLITDVALAPWEAALGAKIAVPTMDGDVTLTIPPGSSSGQKLRLKDKGLPPRNKDKSSGDLYVRLKIVVPKTLTDAERALYEQLRDTSTFQPRTP